ncbi:MAG: site-2 protease family protein, partial [Bacilli bacterium]|nr:site-2 protease family protein [Bacilli bacterium]
ETGGGLVGDLAAAVVLDSKAGIVIHREDDFVGTGVVGVEQRQIVRGRISRVVDGIGAGCHQVARSFGSQGQIVLIVVRGTVGRRVGRGKRGGVAVVLAECAFKETFYIWERYNSFGDAVKNTFVDFGYSAGVIYRSLGSLFVSAENWKNVGGIISIGVQTSNILANMGIGRFLYVWALISVNLAIINLLPFPGLDGWQILVLVVEMVAHREIPEKVKNIVSIVGLVLLMALAALILVKDIIGLF